MHSLQGNAGRFTLRIEIDSRNLTRYFPNLRLSLPLIESSEVRSVLENVPISAARAGVTRTTFSSPRGMDRCNSYIAMFSWEVDLDEVDGSLHGIFTAGRYGHCQERPHVAVGGIDGVFHSLVVLAVVGQGADEMLPS